MGHRFLLTFQLYEAGVGSALPIVSVAITRSVWAPRRTLNVVSGEQAA